MYAVLNTPSGSLLINLAKINAVERRDNHNVVLFTSDKTNNITFTYQSNEDAQAALELFVRRLDSQRS